MRDDPSVRDKLSKQKMTPVTKEAGERMARDLGAVKYVECSALTQYKLKDVFDEVNYRHNFLEQEVVILTHARRQSSQHWSLRRSLVRSAAASSYN